MPHETSYYIDGQAMAAFYLWVNQLHVPVFTKHRTKSLLAHAKSKTDKSFVDENSYYKYQMEGHHGKEKVLVRQKDNGFKLKAIPSIS